MWLDYYLKFADEVEAVIDIEGAAVDRIGAIEGLDGYHVNLRLKTELPEHLVPYQVFPTTPVRVWA